MTKYDEFIRKMKEMAAANKHSLKVWENAYTGRLIINVDNELIAVNAAEVKAEVQETGASVTFIEALGKLMQRADKEAEHDT